MHHTVSGLLILFLFPISTQLRAEDGVLQRVRDEVHADRKSEASRDGTGDHCSSTSLWPEVENLEWWTIVGLPFSLPYYALGDSYSNMDAWHMPQPYGGYGRGSPPTAFRLSLDESNDFHGLNRINGRLLFDTCMRFGIETDWTYLHERLSSGRTDEMVLGVTNVLFRFAQSERAQFRTGLGARMLADKGTARFGFNFTYGADFFPVKPLVVSSVIDLGTLGSAGVFHTRLTGGITHSGWEIFAGYDYLRIESVRLQGPVVGIRYWF